jgi:peptide/nickel transport system ATP-binding protein
VVRAVDGVSFAVDRGKVLGLVGESGSGKTVTGFSIMGLVDPPGRIAGGKILFKGRDLASLSEEEMRALRGNRIAMIFQDPMMTLNPVLRIDTQMIETVQAHERVSREEARQRARDALGQVGIPSPDERLRATRTSSPAGCASASPSPSRCCTNRTSSSRTSRPRRST